MHVTIESFVTAFYLKKGELLNQEPNIMDFDKSEICPCFFYGSNMCCDSYSGHKMS
jgi:hypothetical protein